MKAPHFWYPKNKKLNLTEKLLPTLLSPFSRAFTVATVARRLIARPYKARVPVICIGNVVAGGAGKTPTALALARIMRAHGERPVFVTRGYGGNGHNTYVDAPRQMAEEVGDEALLLAASAPTWTGSDRRQSMELAAAHGTVIIMDDGLQNPNFAPTLSLLVIDGESGIGNGRILPAGPLRESLAAALKRVAAVIIIGRDKHNIAAEAKKHGKRPVFHAHLRPHLPPAFPRKGKYLAFAGIGRPEKFYQTARDLKLDIIDTVDFADHHPYTQNDIDDLRLRAETQGARLLTTEKDTVRLPSDFRAEIITLPVTLAFDAPDAEEKLAHICFDLS